jgi:hypothetical protein
MDPKNIWLLTIQIITIVLIFMYTNKNFSKLLCNDRLVYSIKEVSDRYMIDIEPAGFTFSIWSLIYVLLIIQSITLDSDKIDNIIIVLYGLSGFFNILWLDLFLTGRIISSSFSLISLSTIVWILFVIVDDSFSKVLFSIYGSWTVIASIGK